MPQGKPKFKKQQRPATNTKLGKHIAKDRTSQSAHAPSEFSHSRISPRQAQAGQEHRDCEVEKGRTRTPSVLWPMRSPRTQKLTSQLASQIETSMAVKAASAGARLKLLKAPEETTKGKQTQKPKEKR